MVALIKYDPRAILVRSKFEERRCRSISHRLLAFVYRDKADVCLGVIKSQSHVDSRGEEAVKELRACRFLTWIE